MRAARPALTALLTLILVGLLTPMGAGAVVRRAAGKVDPCSLVTDDAVASLSGGWTIEKTDELSAKNCLVYLTGDTDSGTVNVFVDARSDFTSQKSFTSKTKSAKGLGSGAYSGVVGGDPVVGFTAKPAAVRLTSGTLEAPDLILLAKGARSSLS